MSGAFKQLISHTLCFATHSESHVTLDSDGSESFTTHSPGPPFCHCASLREWSELASSLTLTSAEGPRSPFHPPCSPPLSLQPLSAEAVWAMTEVHGPITTPLHGCGGDVPGALLHLQSCKSREAGMLTHTLDTTSRMTGEANETVSQTGDPPAGGKSPPRKSCPRRRRACGVPGPGTKGGAVRGARQAEAARTAPWQLHQRVHLLLSHTSGHRPLKACERRGGLVESRVKAPFSSSLPSCTRQKLAGAGLLSAFS